MTAPHRLVVPALKWGGGIHSLPFEPFYPRKFSFASISMYAPNQPGVYGITNSRQWILIAETANIRSALLEHCAPSAGEVLRLNPTGFVFEVCQGAARTARRDRLIAEYAPVCNPSSSPPRETQRR